MAPEEQARRDCDVLVIGAGGAGMRAAIAASEAGCHTTMVSKSLLGKAHTVMAEGGIAAALGNVEDDDWETHFADTMLGGQMLNDWRMVDVYSREVIDRVVELEQWGGLFDRTPAGLIMQRAFGAHSRRRLCHVGDRTGLEIIRTLQERVIHDGGIEVDTECTMTRLLRDGPAVVGAAGYRRGDGALVAYRAGAVILATGGWGRMYRQTSNSWEGTGDGAAMAYEAGAELVDMEFVQFHPTGMVWPPGARGILVTEAVRGEGGRLLNRQGRRFMDDYDPVKRELSSRDVVARAIHREVEAGRGGPHGGVFLDIRHRGAAHVRRTLPSMVEQFRALASLDITREPMEVGPTVHYTMGGVRVDPWSCATTVPGLYAAGEVAAGLHGANRLGGNSLGDILVFGRRAGSAAAEFAAGRGPVPPLDEAQLAAEREELLRPLGEVTSPGPNAPTGENPYDLHSELQDVMHERAGIARTEASLLGALTAILALRGRARRLGVIGDRVFNPGWHACREVEFMLTVSEAIVRSALERRESRGAHWRLDFPAASEEEGGRRLVVHKRGGEMEVASVPVPPLPQAVLGRVRRSRFHGHESSTVTSDHE